MGQGEGRDRRPDTVVVDLLIRLAHGPVIDATTLGRTVARLTAAPSQWTGATTSRGGLG
jgi:hypothetical protein